MSGPSTEGSVLVVFLRRPALHTGKQRIAADIGAQLAFELTQCLLDAVLEDACDWPGRVVLSPASATDAGWAAGLLNGRAGVIPQPDGNLGARINHVDRCIRETSGDSGDKLIFVGSDAPVLDSTYLNDGCQALNSSDVVLGPADDGGVTLMGARRAWPDLSRLPWETPQLGKALEALCVGQDFTVTQLLRHPLV